jgi:hypothetical protein
MMLPCIMLIFTLLGEVEIRWNIYNVVLFCLVFCRIRVRAGVRGLGLVKVRARIRVRG